MYNPFSNMLTAHASQFGGQPQYGSGTDNSFSQFMGGGGGMGQPQWPHPSQYGMFTGTFGGGQGNDQQQDNFADRAADKPWKFGPAPGGGFMRLQGGMPDPNRQPRPMQPPMQPPTQGGQQGQGFGNEQQQPMQSPQYGNIFGGGY